MRTTYTFIVLFLAFFLNGCGPAWRKPSVLHHDNARIFWKHCTACIKNKCPDEEQCKRNMSDKYIKKAFHLVIAHNNFDSFKFFLDEIKIDPDAILDDKYNDTPLSVTSYYSGGYSLEMAKILVERGANVNHITGGEDRTPLLTAIWKKNNAVARYLLQNGADPAIKSGRGFNACIAAHRWSNYEIMPDLPGCCERIMNIESDAVLVEEKLRPPELVKYCKK